MRKIATANELEAELSKLLRYSREPRPSRILMAGELQRLALRLAGEIPEAFKENIEKMKAKSKEKKDDEEDGDSDE